jgi:formate C-acetyltransferase
VQYNILGADVLRAAKLEPEKHRDLIVRVGGYSAYFVALSPEIQDEIIARTEHQL